MLLKKLSTIGVAVVASLTLATSAAVVARQATSARRGDQASRQIVRGSVGLAGEPATPLALRRRSSEHRKKIKRIQPIGSSSSASTSSCSRLKFKL
jgi:hypothetical protein